MVNARPWGHLWSSTMSGRRHPLTRDGSFDFFGSPVRFSETNPVSPKLDCGRRSKAESLDCKDQWTLLPIGEWLSKIIWKNFYTLQYQSFSIFNDCLSDSKFLHLPRRGVAVLCTKITPWRKVYTRGEKIVFC